MSQGAAMLDNRGHASPKEQIQRLILTKIDAVSGQNLRQATAAQHLAIDQDAVAVEDDEIGLGHRARSAPPIRSYTQALGNNPTKCAPPELWTPVRRLHSPTQGRGMNRRVPEA